MCREFKEKTNGNSRIWEVQRIRLELKTLLAISCAISLSITSHRSTVNYSDLDAPEIIRSAPLFSEGNLSARNSSRPLPGFQNRSDLPSSNKSFLSPYRGQSPPSGFQNNDFVGGQHPHSEVGSRSDLPFSNKNFLSPYRGQSPPLGFQNNHFDVVQIYHLVIRASPVLIEDNHLLRVSRTIPLLVASILILKFSIVQIYYLVIRASRVLTEDNHLLQVSRTIPLLVASILILKFSIVQIYLQAVRASQALTEDDHLPRVSRKISLMVASILTVKFSTFNEVLDRSMKKVAEAVKTNPTDWPSPEIGLIEKSSNEYLAAVLYLPSIGWSSVSRTEAVLSALNDSKFPTFKDNLSWLPAGLNDGGDIEIQKSHLENCLIEYLTETSRMMGLAMAQRLARGIIQKCIGLELHNSRFYIVPKWVQIFRSIFNLWLVNLTNVEMSSTCVLVQDDFSAPGNDSEFRGHKFSSSHIVSPSFDELVEVSCNNYESGLVHIDYQETRPLSTMASDVPMSIDKTILTSYDCFVTGVNTEVQMVDTMKTSPEADRLSEMLKKCDIMQNVMHKKLSIYF